MPHNLESLPPLQLLPKLSLVSCRSNCWPAVVGGPGLEIR